MRYYEANEVVLCPLEISGQITAGILEEIKRKARENGGTLRREEKGRNDYFIEFSFGSLIDKQKFLDSINK